MWEAAFPVGAWGVFFLVINVALKLQGAHDAPNFITQKDMKCIGESL